MCHEKDSPINTFILKLLIQDWIFIQNDIKDLSTCNIDTFCKKVFRTKILSQKYSQYNASEKR